MRLLILLAFSLLFTTVASNREAPYTKPKATNHSHIEKDNIQLTLHHPRSPSSPSPLPPLPFSTVLHHDDHRVESLTSRLLHKSKSKNIYKTKTIKKPSPSSSSMASNPLSSGTSLGVGNYVTQIHLGTPSKSYVMVVDTGSSLSWLQCKPCRISCHEQVGPIFDPSASSSYTPLPCSSSPCRTLESATLNPSGCSPSHQCVYEASYGDSSFSVGYLSQDTLSFSSLALPNFIYGCGQDNEGLFGKSAGLIGLAKNHLSLLSQLAPKAGALAFSYCLPTSSSTGTLSFGTYPAAKFAYTPMLSSSLDDSLYFIKLSAITVAGKTVSVSSSSYNLPTIIDSGTVITRLPRDIYDALSTAVVGAIGKKYESAPAYSILDTCFVGNVESMVVPEVSLVFTGGAALKLPGRNVLINVDDDTACLAFAASYRVAIIGNRQQQTFSVVYDVAKGKVGFAAGGCG